MLLRSGSPAGVTFNQVLASRVTWICPFDVPAQMRFSAAAESAMTLMVALLLRARSAGFGAGALGAASTLVRSGLISDQLAPPSSDRMTNCAPTSSVFLFCDERAT